MKENEIQAKIRMAAHKFGLTLFRNNRGKFKTLDGQRIVDAGLSADGSGDLIGWKKITVTPDMVGKEIAIFCSVEVKSAKGVISPKQEHFKRVVSNSGGIAIIARSVEDLSLVL